MAQTLRKTRTNAVVVTSGSALDQALSQAEEWKQVSKSADFTLYELRSPAALLPVSGTQRVE